MPENKETNSTKVYAYKVEMVVHIIADRQRDARNQLDVEGGRIASRDVTLLNVTDLKAPDEVDEK